MKTKTQIIWALLSLSLGCAGAQDSLSYRFVIDSVGAYEPPVLVLGPQDSLPLVFSVRKIGGYTQPSYDCEFTRREGPWEVVSPGVGGCDGAFESYHDWVLAETDDVEQPGPIVTLVYYPCGSPWQVALGRICSKCGREERRVIFYSYEQRAKPESRFRQLQKKFNGGNN